MDTIRVNGVDYPIDSFDGPTGEELSRAYRRYRSNQQFGGPQGGRQIHGSGSKFVGTPRLQKHKGGCGAYGVRVK